VASEEVYVRMQRKAIRPHFNFPHRYYINICQKVPDPVWLCIQPSSQAVSLKLGVAANGHASCPPVPVQGAACWYLVGCLGAGSMRRKLAFERPGRGSGERQAEESDQVATGRCQG
jgi:hypothetical protein